MTLDLSIDFETMPKPQATKLKKNKYGTIIKK